MTEWKKFGKTSTELLSDFEKHLKGVEKSLEKPVRNYNDPVTREDWDYDCRMITWKRI